MKSTLRFVSIFGERYQLARRQFFMRSKIKFDYPFEFANCFDNHTLRTVKSLPLNADVLLVTRQEILIVVVLSIAAVSEC
jgi:hypothetical protein